MEAVLNRKPEDLEDYYGILGCDELSSTEQILNEYKIRALACHPDKHLDNPAAVADFQKLQEAKEVLCDEAKRQNYDLWKRSGVTIPFHDCRCTGPSEVRRNLCWRLRERNHRPRQKQTTFTRKKKPQRSFHTRLHHPQVIIVIAASVGLLIPLLLCCKGSGITKYRVMLKD